MMPKPNQNTHKININRDNFQGISSEKVLLDTKPNFWLYSENFILKIVVLLLLVLMFAPIMTLVYSVNNQLINTFRISIDNAMFYAELILILLIVVVIIKLALDVLDWNYTNYILTDARIIIERGFIHKEKLIISYNKIQDIEIRQSILERIINVGDIIIYGANEMSDTILDDIPAPKKVEEIIVTNVNKNSFTNQNVYPNNQTYYNGPYPNQQANIPYNNQQMNGQYNNQQMPGPYPNQQQNPQYNNQQQNQQNNYNNQNTQENYQYIQPDHDNKEKHHYLKHDEDDEVIIPDKQTRKQMYENREKYSTQKINKEEVFRKHDEMFRKHKK
ncbi:PH domain-containing protein [Methanosphaera sp. ISO3-F5]|uniref:PH domain-containing protein n=1 Tax=Methanosphaera sp. ISO3-F5 TaxID=1452353 RepID=UPI002B25F3DA|nr:PH domain-containing protein [Methanosphaera sp. ISO3-F5]WQH64325.1 PH domain-containing protein [Methanosphaera sp. ISO3-F5]